jgi:hypothetical protein
MLARQVLFFSHASTLFNLVILEIGSHFLPRPTWTMILLFVAGKTGMHYQTQLFSVEMGS